MTPSTTNPDWPPLGWFEFLRTHSPPMETESTFVHQPHSQSVLDGFLVMGADWGGRWAGGAAA